MVGDELEEEVGRRCDGLCSLPGCCYWRNTALLHEDGRLVAVAAARGEAPSYPACGGELAVREESVRLLRKFKTGMGLRCWLKMRGNGGKTSLGSGGNEGWFARVKWRPAGRGGWRRQ